MKANLEAVCGYYGCSRETEVILYQGKISGFRCSKHSYDEIKPLESPVQKNHNMWWILQGWLSLIAGTIYYGFLGFSLVWLPLLVVLLLPSLIVLWRKYA